MMNVPVVFVGERLEKHLRIRKKPSRGHKHLKMIASFWSQLRPTSIVYGPIHFVAIDRHLSPKERQTLSDSKGAPKTTFGDEDQQIY